MYMDSNLRTTLAGRWPIRQYKAEYQIIALLGLRKYFWSPNQTKHHLILMWLELHSRPCCVTLFFRPRSGWMRQKRNEKVPFKHCWRFRTWTAPHNCTWSRSEDDEPRSRTAHISGPAGRDSEKWKSRQCTIIETERGVERQQCTVSRRDDSCNHRRAACQTRKSSCSKSLYRSAKRYLSRRYIRCEGFGCKQAVDHGRGIPGQFIAHTVR